MSARRHALILALAFLVIAVSVNLIASSLLRGARLDLSESRLYSLSPGTRSVLDTVAEPIELTLYYSRTAGAEYPAVRTYAARVRELLQSYVARSRGKIRLREVDPQRFTEAEDEAIAAGVTPLPLGPGAEPIYFGIVGANAVDETVVLPALSWGREAFLEYELTRLVAELEAPQRPRIALISALPLDPVAAADPRTGPQSGQPLWLQDLARMADVVPLAPDFTALPPDATLVALIHPWPLSDGQLRVVDQFILSKGRAVIAVDPAALTAQPQSPDPFMPPPPPASDLNGLIRAWGLTVSTDAVMDARAGVPIQPGAPPQPLFFAIEPDRLARDELMTAGLARGLTVLAPGAISWTEPSGVTVTPLARTTADTMRLDAARAGLFPPAEELLAGFVSASRQETIAVRVAGTLSTAYPGAGLAKSAAPAEIVLVADVDFLDDRLYFDPQQGPMRDNAALILNAFDRLAGSDALVSLRSRAPSARPLTLVEGLRAKAERQAASTQAALEKEVADTESRLAALQAKGAGSGFFAGELGAELSSAERQEVERFQARLLELRAELRDSERRARAELAGLETWTTVINTWAMPLLVGLIGLALFWRRRRKTADLGRSTREPS